MTAITARSNPCPPRSFQHPDTGVRPDAARSPRPLQKLDPVFAKVIGAAFQEQITGYCNRAGFKPKILFELGDTYSVLTMVAAGFGVAILPQWVQQTHHPRLVYRPLAEIPPIVDLALTWVTDTQTEQARAFLDCAYRFTHATL